MVSHALRSTIRHFRKLFVWALWFLVGLCWGAWFLTSSDLPDAAWGPVVLLPGWTLGPVTLPLARGRQALSAMGIGFEALAQILTGLATVLSGLLLGKHFVTRSQQHQTEAVAQPSAARLRRERSQLIRRVRSTWIDGVLQNSLYRSIRIELGKEAHPQAIQRPWDAVLQPYGEQPRLLPPDTPIVEVFDAASGWLLLLGDPGSGKTTLMLELLEALLARAEVDETQPLPVFLTLSLWRDPDQTLDAWLLDQLDTTYGVDRAVACYWRDEQLIIPVLDALDEAPVDVQASCLRAINAFRAQHKAPLAVSSRANEYADLGERLVAGAAVRVQPLSPARIEKYLVDLCAEGDALRTLLAREPQLQELACIPLFLNIMAVSAQALAEQTFAADMPESAVRQQVIESFVVARLRQAAARGIYGAPATIPLSLHTIARAMASRKFVVFHPDYFTILGYYAGFKPLPHKLITIMASIYLVVGSFFYTLLARVIFLRDAGRTAREMLGVRASSGESSRLPILLLLLPLFAALYFIMRRSLQIEQLAKTGAQPRIHAGIVVRKSLQTFITIVGSNLGFKDLLAVALTSTLVWWMIPAQGAEHSLPVRWAANLFHFWHMPGPAVIAFFFVVLGMGALILWQNVGPLAYLFWVQHFPLNSRRFLEACVKLKLLYRVGPGYTFIHRLLLEYFAELDQVRLAHLAAGVEHRHSATVPRSR